MSEFDGPKSISPTSDGPALAAGDTAPAIDQRAVEPCLSEFALRCNDVGEQLLARHVEQMQLQVFVELEARDHPLHAAPDSLERLERRRMQQRAHLLLDRSVHRGEVRLALVRRVLDDVRRDDVADQRVESVGRRRDGCRGLWRFAQQATKQIAAPDLRVGARLTQPLEQLQPGVQPVGMKIVELRELDFAGRHAQPRRQAFHDVVERVDVHARDRPGRQRRPFCCRFAAEVAQHQQTHRFVFVARTPAAAKTEVELQMSWHRSLPGSTPQTSRRRVIRRFALRAGDCGADGRSP